MPDTQAHTPEEAPTTPRRRAQRAFGLFDRLAVVREHWLGAGIVFTIVFGLIVFQALRSTPTYEASSTLTIASSMGGLGEDLSVALGRPSKVETEMEVLRSFSVAQGAARLLIGLEAHPPSEALARSVRAVKASEEAFAKSRRELLAGGDGAPATESPKKSQASPAAAQIAPFNVRAQEINAYRPWEVLVRRFTDSPAPLRLQVRTDELPEEGGREFYRFDFAVDGKGVRVTPDAVEHGDKAEALLPFAWDQPLTVRGRTFLLSRPDGEIGGRSYDVRVYSPTAYAESLYGGVKVNPVGRYTDMVEIVCSASAPHEAKAYSTALAQSYLALRQMRKNEAVFVNQDHLAGEVLKYLAVLEPLEQELDRYISEENAGGLTEQATALLERFENLSSSQADLKRELEEAGSRLDELEQGIGSEDVEQLRILLGEKAADARVIVLLGKDADLKSGLEELMFAKTRTDSPKYRLQETLIKANRADLLRTLARVLEHQIVAQQSLVKGLKGNIADVSAELLDVQEKREALPKTQRGLAVRQEEVDRIRQILEPHHEKLMMLRSAGSVDDVVASLVDQARLPGSRKKPSLLRMGLLGAFLGLLAGVGLAFLLESLDHKVRTPQQLEEGTGLTIYGSIPAHGKKMRRGKLEASLITIEKPNSIVTEAYRSLRANVRFANKGKRVRAMAVTSALPGEGKTTTTCNLGVVFAQGGNRTLIVDADMRRPSTHLRFGGSRSPGLSDVLQGDTSWQEVLGATGVPDLEILYAGRPTGNPGALLDSKAFVTLLAELREAYDYVLFDVPPALAVPDAAAFFESLDGVLLLTEYGRCRADVVDGAREQVERVGGTVLGAVLNAFDMRRTARRGYGSYGYGGYYGYYGQHGYYGRGESEIDGPSEAASASEDPS